MKKTVNILLFILVSASVFSQQVSFKGIVKDSELNKGLAEVHIQLISQNHSANYYSVSNLNGEFVIKDINKGEYKIIASSVSYNEYQQVITIDSDKTIEISLSKELVNLGEVVVSTTRQDQKIKDIPAPLEIVDNKQIELSSAFTASDVLDQEPGVSVARDGVWATGINIRGLNQQRIVMLVDGNRIETATDLMASMAFFDMDDIKRIEVLKGASSSLYGTGAMGGIVNVITNKGYFNSSSYFNGSINSSYSSANELFTKKLTLNAGSKRWYANISGTMRDANDLRTPEGTLANSQFEDKSISATAGFKINDKQTLEVRYQNFDADNVGIPGGAALPGPSTATYTDAKRNMFSANYKIEDITESLKLINIRYFHQYILRDVDLVPNISTSNPTNTVITTPELFTPSGEHTTDGAQIQSDWSFGKNNKFIAGIDIWRRNLVTSREKYIRVDVYNPAGDIVKTNNIVRGETPIPESTFGSAGLYFQNEQMFLNDKLKLVVGGRIDGIYISNEQAFDYDYLIMNGERNDTPPNQRITFEENEENKLSWSTNIGVLYGLTDDMDLTFNAGRSFRAPSLEESFEYIDLGSKVRLGDPTLDSEKGYSLDAGIRLWKPKFHLNVNIFANWLTDMIVEQPGEFIYSLTAGGVDTIPALINTNINKARLYGVDLSFQYNFYDNFVLHGSGAYVRGEDIKNNTDLPLIPPMNGRFGVKYTLPKYFGVDFVAIGCSDQDNIAEGEMETKGYVRYDLMLNSSLIDLNFARIQLFGGIENITDRAYRNHLATNRGMIKTEAGRNVFVKLKVMF